MTYIFTVLKEKTVLWILLCLFFLSLSVGITNSGLSNSKKTVPGTADGDVKQEGGVTARKPPSHSPPSPLLGNANNPNKTEIPERKRGSTITPNVSLLPVFASV